VAPPPAAHRLGAAPLAAPPPLAPPPPAAALGGILKSTIVGHKAPPQVAAAPAPPAVAAPKFKTALGYGATAQPAPAPAASSDRAPAGSLAPPPGAGPAAAVRPALAPPFTPPAATVSKKSAAAKGAFGATMLGAGPGQAFTPSDQEVDLPALRSDPVPGASGVEIPDDLPALKGAAPEFADLSLSRIRVDDLPGPKGEVDLPAPRGATRAPLPRGEVPSGLSEPEEVDLPTPKKSPAPTPPGGPAGYGDLDLPRPKVATGKHAPAAPPRAAKPAGPAKLSDGGFGDLDLPAPKLSADLPALRGAADLPAPRALVDLPAPRGRADLPAPRMAADLPQVKGTADLPMPKAGMDLPSPKVGGMSFGDLDLPAPKAEFGFGGLDLPTSKGDLPMPKRDESNFADLDLDLPDLPPQGGGGRGRGLDDLELPPPRAAANLVPPKAKTVQGMGGARGPATDESSFGDLSLEPGDSDLPPSLMGEDESSFSDLDLTEEPPSDRPAAPRPRARAQQHTEEIEEIEPDAGEGEEIEGDESYDGADFGEADFQEGEEEDGGEDMEFGISGEDGERASLPPEVLRRQRGEDFEAKQAARGRRTVTIFLRVAILLGVLGAGGAALTFTEYGVFGIYFWERWLPEAGNAQFARGAIEKAEKIAASDAFVDVKRSLKELGEARGKAGLNRDLLTRSLMHQSLSIVRFGEDPNAAAHAAAILKRLEERSWQAPGIDLARAADAARRKQWREAAAPLERARAQAGSDPYVELIAGEVALAESKKDAAEKAFAKALQLGGGARAQWGLARIALLGSDLEAQRTAVNETLKLSPMHVEARIAEARIAWTQGKEDRSLHLVRVALGLDPTEEDQYLWTSKQAVSAGYGLLGFIHESRGRLHPAREAYEQALSADPSRVEALLGSGRVLLREKRFSDAQARFESALSAATKGGENPNVLSGRKADLEAKLGIGRALLALGRAQEAKDRLDELTAALPNDPDIVLAEGEAAQALGNMDTAENQFHKSIDLAPKRFDGYLALSQFFSKKGDVAKASEILNEAALHVEETAEMRRMLGQSELARNRFESAIHEFKRALELDPHDVDAMFGTALALRKRGDLDQAQQTLEEISKRDPGYAGLAEQSGLLFEARGEYAKAVGAYRAALEKDPGDNAMLLRLGAAQVSAGDFDTAEQTLAKVIREMPNSAEAEYFIGRIAFARGRTPDALTHFDRAVGLDGTKGEFHLYVARASLEMGNLGRTLEEIAAAMNYDPSLGDSFWVRATVRLRMGAVKDALSDLNKALKLNPARTEAYAVQGDCYEQLRQLPDAIHAYRTALDKVPTRGEWWYRLAILQADSGNRAESDGDVRHALEIGDKTDPIPYWLPDAYRLSGENAEARGDRTAAIRSYKRYVEIASTAAIDHTAIHKKLKAWGVQLEEEL
jgi:tetratricopeptide (TPR) repeat protein